MNTFLELLNICVCQVTLRLEGWQDLKGPIEA